MLRRSRRSRLTPSQTDVRRWYIASIILGLPWWWPSLRIPLGYLAIAYLCGWIAAIVLTPCVDRRPRLAGFGIGLGLMFGLWLVTVIVVGHFFGDAKSQAGMP